MRTSRRDWKQFLDNGFICVHPRRLKRVYDETLKNCVKFSFSRDNRQLLACGTKIVRLSDGDSFQFPKIRRTNIRLRIYRAYRQYILDSHGGKGIGRTNFMKMLSMLTNGQKRMEGCVYYHLGVLVFEYVRNACHISRIVQDRVSDVAQRN